MSIWRYLLPIFSGLLLIFFGWHWAAITFGELVMATPLQAFDAMLDILSQPLSQAHLWLSVQRMLQGIFIGCMAGFFAGLLAGFSLNVRLMLAPLRWFLMAVPPVVLVVMAMLWFGMDSLMVVFTASILLAPGIYINTEKAIRSVDVQLLEMAEVYRFSLWQKITSVYVPSIAAPLSAAVLIALCNGVRIVVLAEVLGSGQGIGYALASARSNFDSAQLYGWVLLILCIVAVLEWLVLQPLQHRLTRWQRGAQHVAA